MELSQRAIRSHLIENFNFSHILFNRIEQGRFNNLWNEIVKVDGVDAWRSFSNLCGQLIEAALRFKLFELSLIDIETSFNIKSLGQLITFSKKTPLFPDPQEELTGKAAISTALILRNWSSHASLIYKSPSELNATHSLVLLICILNNLFPLHNRTFKNVRFNTSLDLSFFIQNWSEIYPSTIVNLIKKYSHDLKIDPKSYYNHDILTHIIKYGRATTLYKLIDLSFKLNLDQDILIDCIISNYYNIICNASNSSIRSINELVWRFRKLNLTLHSKLYAILLPFDYEVLQYLICNRSHAWISRYLAECVRTKPEVFRSVTGNLKRMQPIISSFWEMFDVNNDNILNAANIIKTFPIPLKIDFLKSSPSTKLLEWIEKSDVLNSINLIYLMKNSFINEKKDLLVLRERALNSFLIKLKKTDLHHLHQLPLRLCRLRLVDEEIGIVILKELLLKISIFRKVEFETTPIRRILWDIYIYCEQLRSTAISITQEFLEKNHSNIDEWNRTCLIGMLIVADITNEIVSINNTDKFYNNLMNDNIDRWQRFLAALSFPDVKSRNDKKIHKCLNILSNLIAETKTADTGPSRELVQKSSSVVHNRIAELKR